MYKYAALLATASATMTEDDIEHQIMEIEATMDLIKWTVSKDDAKKIDAAGSKMKKAADAYEMNPKVLKSGEENFKKLAKTKEMKALEKFMEEHDPSKDEKLKKQMGECKKAEADLQLAAQKLGATAEKTP